MSAALLLFMAWLFALAGTWGAAASRGDSFLAGASIMFALFLALEAGRESNRGRR